MCLAGGRPGREHVVADQQRRRGRRPGQAAQPRRRTAIEPARLAARCAARQPGLVGDRAALPQQRRARRRGRPAGAGTAAAARATRSIGSCPRERTTAGREGTGTSTARPPASSAARTAASEELARAARARVYAARSLCARIIGAQESGVLAGGEAGGQPVRARGGAHPRRAAPGSAARSGAHSERPGAGHPTHARAVEQVEPARRSQPAVSRPIGARRRPPPRRLWTRPTTVGRCAVAGSACVRGRRDLGAGAAATARCCSACRAAGRA